MVDVLKARDFFGPEEFPIVVARREPQPEFPRHRHQFSELVVVTGGTGLHAIRDEEYPVAAGDAFVIADNSPHEYRDMKDLSLVNILYDPHSLGMASWDVRAMPGYHALFKLEPRYRKKHKFESRLRMNVEDLSAVRSLMDELEVELDQRRPGFRLVATGLFMQIVGHLSRCYGQSRAGTSRALLRIGEAIAYLEEHYDRDITLDQLSDIAHMSRRNFSRTFRDAMSRSAIDHLLHLRIARASELLRAGEVTVTEAAMRVGFVDSSYFARQYKKITGHAPRETMTQ